MGKPRTVKELEKEWDLLAEEIPDDLTTDIQTKFWLPETLNHFDLISHIINLNEKIKSLENDVEMLKAKTPDYYG
jgi:hypothetical protein